MDITTAEHKTTAEYKTVHELLADESRWCKGALARTSSGHTCFSCDPGAKQWCLIGAMDLVCQQNKSDWLDTYNKLMEAVLRKTGCGYDSLAEFNDNVVHNILVEVLKDANV